jgi:hypothetical protein
LPQIIITELDFRKDETNYKVFTDQFALLSKISKSNMKHKKIALSWVKDIICYMECQNYLAVDFHDSVVLTQLQQTLIEMLAETGNSK